MVLIEFFDGSPVENLVGCLTLRPERVIFLGDRKEMARKQADQQRFLHALGITDTVLEYRSVNRGDLHALVETLTALASEFPDCCFSLTGGEHLSMVALGIVYARDPSLRLRRFQIRSGRVYDGGLGGRQLPLKIPGITVAENILLHGGSVVSATEKSGGTEHWDLDAEFREDVQTMWDICRRNCSQWNAQISALGSMEKIRFQQPELEFQVNVPHAMDFLKQQKLKFNSHEVYDALEQAGMIRGLRSDGVSFSFTYKNSQVRRSLGKAGTILELITFLTARTLRDKDGEPLYQDAMTGVRIDWDGHLHGGDGQVDTENEIDVILMRGMTPIFISCKNGAVGHEELYKLHTVARRFGGVYARQVLIATTFGRDSDNKPYFLERAKDMDITVIEGVHQMTQAEFADALRRLAE